MSLLPTTSALAAAEVPPKQAKSSAADTAVKEPLGDWVTVQATRLPQNPIITPKMFSNTKDGSNINGPTLVRVPAWVKNPLGKYYLYFAHHGGTYIRMAYADCVAGPYKLHAGGVLALDHLSVTLDHIASPEILVDEQAQRLILYYHGPVRQAEPAKNPSQWGGQLTFAATSADGLTFTPHPEVISSSYLRVFPYAGRFYGISKNGNVGISFSRSDDPLACFEKGSRIFPNGRHVALLHKGNTLWVFLSRGGDCPEQILMTRFDITGDWTTWAASAPSPVAVIKPEQPWEGTQYPLKPSDWGAGDKVQELRDPFVFEENGKLYLFYTVAGEMGIAIAELDFSPTDKGPHTGCFFRPPPEAGQETGS
ncbi:MAG: hypothetical protein AAB263_17220 [Planctomycetota bacterium]